MRRHLTLIGIYASIFPAMLGNGMVMALLPGRVMEMTGSVSAVGGIASAFALSYLLLQLPLGRLGDRYGFKLLLVSGYGLCGASGLIYLRADSTAAIYLGRLLQGAGEVPLWALAAAMLSIAYPDQKGRVLGGYNALFHLGLFAGPMAGLLAGRWGGSYNGAFCFYATASFTGAFLVGALVSEPSDKKETTIVPMGSNTRLSLCDPNRSRRTLCGICIYGMAYGIMLTVVPAFLSVEKGFDQTAISFFFSLFFIAVSVSQLIAGPLCDRGLRRPCMNTGLFCAAGGLAAAAVSNGAFAMAALGTACLGLGGYHVASLIELNEAAPADMKGAVSGAYYLLWGMGYFAGPLAAGMLCDWLGGAFGLVLPAGLLAVSALSLVFGGSVGKDTMP
ncbi:MAG: MFS transporter [Desulfobacterales bacterium]|nr:MFS transporter [Desulfobacterales bacterium]